MSENLIVNMVNQLTSQSNTDFRACIRNRSVGHLMSLLLQRKGWEVQCLTKVGKSSGHKWFYEPDAATRLSARLRLCCKRNKQNHAYQFKQRIQKENSFSWSLVYSFKESFSIKFIPSLHTKTKLFLWRKLSLRRKLPLWRRLSLWTKLPYKWNIIKMTYQL